MTTKDHGPVCLELFPEGMCAKPATHEVTSGLDDWCAKCESCARAWPTRRLLTKARRDAHELAQWRAGTIRLPQC